MPQPLRRSPDVHPDDGGTAESDISQHFAGTSGRNNARVWGGMHYPSTIAVSDAVGQAIANYVNLNAMRRIHGTQESRARHLEDVHARQ